MIKQVIMMQASRVRRSFQKMLRRNALTLPLLKFISRAPYRQNVFGVFGRVLDFFTQMTNMGVNGPVKRLKFPLSYFIKEPVPAENDARVRC
jgi:hypothetical protein